MTTRVKFTRAEYAGFPLIAAVPFAGIRLTNTLDTNLPVSADEATTACAHARAVLTYLIKSTGYVRTAEDTITLTAEGAVATLYASAWIIYAEVKLTALTFLTAGGFASISEAFPLDTNLTFFALYPYAKISTRTGLRNTLLAFHADHARAVTHACIFFTEIAQGTFIAARYVASTGGTTLA